jgi:Tol biopolymer transport system component
MILFTRTLTGDDLQTFTVGIDGSQETELTDVSDCCGSWSPDGTIIMAPDKVASSRLLPATVNADGTSYSVHSIGSPTLNLAPAGWSPDGNKIAFEGWDDTDPSRTGLYVSEGFTLTEAAPVQITQALVHDIALEWSPDGTRLLLIQVTRCPEGDCDGGDLFVVDSDGSDLTRLNPEGTFVSCCNPASWSPDGTQVTFGAPSLGSTGAADFTKSAVYVAEADGSRVKAITGPGAFTEGAEWSPTADWIVFNKKSGPVGVKGSDLFLIHPDGSGLSAITTAGAAGKSDQVGAVWSPDGTRLLFTVVPGGPVKRGDLRIVDLDGTDPTRLTDAPAQYFGYSWQPRN